MTITPYTPEQFLNVARETASVGDKISVLKRLSQGFPRNPATDAGREQLVQLLTQSNRYDEALQQYRKFHAEPGVGDPLDFKLIELLLRTGNYSDVLRLTSPVVELEPDLHRDMKLMEARVQALLARGLYEGARECVDEWLEKYGHEIVPGSRFDSDLQSFRYLRGHLRRLERISGPKGKALFTASVPHSLLRWSQRQQVPIVFFKLIPARAVRQLAAPLVPGHHANATYFEERVAELNKGFDYLSGGQFSLNFTGAKTLYVTEGDIDPQSSGGHLLTSRVYAHTIPQVYKLSGESFVVLVDYRVESEDEAAYMGDGIIHISATKLQTLILMHEILHGLGATHQDWSMFQALGYRFDLEDRGLMTFQHGQIVDLGLEEKNRALLGWPQVSVIRPHVAYEGPSTIVESITEPAKPAEKTTTAFTKPPSSPELIPAL